MQNTTSVFLDYSGEVADLSRVLAGVVGRELVPDYPDVRTTYTGVVLSIEFVLMDDHGLVDDRGILFSQYRFQLQMMPVKPGRESPCYGSMYDAVALFVAQRVSETLSCRSIVVANLGRQLAAFEP